MFQSLSVDTYQGNRTSEAQMLRTLNTFAVDLMSIPSVDDLFWYVAQNVVGKLGFIDCVIYQADEAQTELTQVAAWGLKNPYGRSIINPLVIPFGMGITGQVARDRKPIIMDDLRSDKNYIPDTEPARSEICVPILRGQQIAGVIDSEHPDVAAFGEPELEFLSTVAAMTSAKLELLAETQRSQDRYEQLVTAHTQLTAETKSRKDLQTKLFEARKQDAIGRLTGRFAHEFNNLMTVISGNIELLHLDTAGDLSSDTLRDIELASARGAQLVRDLLAFAQKTRLSPKVLHLNDPVSLFCQEFERSFETPIEQTRVDDLWPVSIDPIALENMLFALALNSLDAMPEGGSLRIASENHFHTPLDSDQFPSELTPGRYVRLSVTDGGHGIAADHLPQVFDPFFTTKKAGQGTGLGLSMVLGVMRQSGGAVAVRSDLGQGTTIQLYFPTAACETEPLNEAT